MSRRPLAGVQEVAEYYGLTENTVRDQVYRHVGIGVLAFRVGRFLRWDWSDLDAWNEAQKQQKHEVA